MALSADRNTPLMGAGGVPVKTNYPVAASTTIYKGALVAINTSGYLVEATTTSTLKVVGISTQHVDNSSGNNGDLTCETLQAVGRFANGNSMTKASVGGLVYVVDDQTVTTSSSGSPPIAGTLYAVDSSGCWVYVGLAAPVDGTALTAFESNLAATTTGNGATLVGIADAGSVITGTTVEAALQEVAKEAQAANCVPFTMPLVLSSVVTATTNVITLNPPKAGKILRLDASVISAPTTTACLFTLTATVSGVASSATLAVTSTNLATRGALVTGATATGASFTAGQLITIVPSAVTTFVEGQILLELFIQSA